MTGPNNPRRTQKRKATRRGVRAEAWAAMWLRLKGFRILARRFKTPVGEVDLIAERGNLLVFAEVKARARRGDGVAAVSRRQQLRITRAAESWIARNPHRLAATMRFDVIEITPFGRPRHIVDAWQTESGT